MATASSNRFVTRSLHFEKRGRVQVLSGNGGTQLTPGCPLQEIPVWHPPMGTFRVFPGTRITCSNTEGPPAPLVSNVKNFPKLSA